MTPELKNACELVFQEHKTTGDPINWNKDSFRGRISFGLSAMAKETLLERNIIYTPNPAKKTITALNPRVAAATSFEEAQELVLKKLPVLTASKIDEESFDVAGPAKNDREQNNYVLLRVAGNKSATAIIKAKRYPRPFFYYTFWFAGAAIAGAFIAWLIGFIFTEFLGK